MFLQLSKQCFPIIKILFSRNTKRLEESYNLQCACNNQACCFRDFLQISMPNSILLITVCFLLTVNKEVLDTRLHTKGLEKKLIYYFITRRKPFHFGKYNGTDVNRLK